jgi:hypothetical protein
MIDWNVATSIAIRWVRPGPQVSLADARQDVAELRTQAAEVACQVMLRSAMSRSSTGQAGSARTSPGSR